MANDISLVLEQFLRDLMVFLLNAQSERRVDRKGFQSLKEQIIQISNTTRGYPYISKEFLFGLRGASKSLLAESEYSSEKEVMMECSDWFEYAFDLILEGEVVS